MRFNMHHKRNGKSPIPPRSCWRVQMHRVILGRAVSESEMTGNDSQARVESRGNRGFLFLLLHHNDWFLQLAICFPLLPRIRALFVAQSAYAILRRPWPPLGQEVTGARS